MQGELDNGLLVLDEDGLSTGIRDEVLWIFTWTRARQQEEAKRETNQQQSSSFLSTTARLYSTVLHTMGYSHVHVDAKTRKINPDRSSGQNDQSSIIINAFSTSSP